MGWSRSISLVTVAVLTLFVTGCGGKTTRLPEASDLRPAPGDTASSRGVIERRGTLRIGVSGVHPPFSYRINADTKQLEGFAVDLGRQITDIILKDDKVSAEFVQMSTFDAWQDGVPDIVIVPRAPMPRELELYQVSSPYYKDSMRVLVRADQGITNVRQLNGKTVAAMAVVNGGARLDASFKKVQPDVTLNFSDFVVMDQAIPWLQEDYVAAVYAPVTELAPFVKPGSGFTLLPEHYESWEYSVLVKRDIDLATAVDKAIKQMITSGKMAELVKQWGFDI